MNQRVNKVVEEDGYERRVQQNYYLALNPMSWKQYNG